MEKYIASFGGVAKRERDVLEALEERAPGALPRRTLA